MKMAPSETSIKVGAAVAISSLTTALVSYWWHQRQLQTETRDWQNRRQEERTGRIRAEVKLRTTLKEVERLRASSIVENASSTTNDTIQMMVLRAVGVVVSPYTKRMGTPRQPQLVPASRGYIEFNVPAASLSGIDEYSHVWIIFQFHANTDIIAQANNNKRRTKIRPPRGGGVKVGQLATRSPHRPNPLGLSLVQIDWWDETTRRLHVKGLDLVNGTPVYDVKPCVIFDIPGYPDHDDAHVPAVLKVPSWVSQKDTIANVEFSNTACLQLREMVAAGRLAPLYTDANDGYTAARQTLQQVLAQDPRSSHKGLKENARGTTSNKSSTESSGQPKPYRLIFGSCQVEFVVLEQGVEVREISAVDFDQDSYVDGVPLISESQHSSVDR